MKLFTCLALIFLVALAEGRSQPKRISLYSSGLMDAIDDQTENIIEALKLTPDHEIQLIEAKNSNAYNLDRKDRSWSTEEFYNVRFNMFDTKEGFVVREDCSVVLRKSNVDTIFNLSGDLNCQKSY